jgi:hypothetical protein
MTQYSLAGITANGTYSIEAKFVGTEYAIYASGTFGGGTITYGYVDADAQFVAFKKPDDSNLTTTSSSGYLVIAPPSGALAVRVEGSTNPDIKISLARKQG